MDRQTLDIIARRAYSKYYRAYKKAHCYWCDNRHFRFELVKFLFPGGYPATSVVVCKKCAELLGPVYYPLQFTKAKESQPSTDRRE